MLGPRNPEAPTHLPWPKRRRVEIGKSSAPAVERWFPRPSGDGGILGNLFFLQYEADRYAIGTHVLSLLEGCVPPMDTPLLDALKASAVPEMSAHLATRLVTVRALVHRLVKRVHET